MRSWPKSTERLLGVSARLLAGASVLTTVGVGLAVRMSWQQTGHGYGPDGTIVGAGVPLAQHLSMLMLDLSYRPIGVQLLLASALVAAAVAVLHRRGAGAQVRLLRWEVLAAGLVTLVPVLVLLLANLYALTPSDDPNGGMPEFMGPQPTTELTLGNLPLLVATVLTLTGAGLWWLRLGVVDALGDGVETSDETAANETASESATETASESATETDVEVDGVLSGPVPASLGSSGRHAVEATTDYRHDWSPEDFRPPR